MYCSVFFFFKQKTAYEMRISDWSSDVCSSDLDQVDEQELLRQHEVLLQQPVAQERARLVLEQALVVVEADRAHRVGAQHLRRLPGRAVDAVHADRVDAVEQQFVQRVHQRAFAIQVQAQAVESEPLELRLARRRQPDPRQEEQKAD